MTGQRRGWLASAACATAALFAGCGGGSGGGSGTTPPPPPPPTPEVITITSSPNVTCARTLAFTEALQETGASGPVTWSISSGQLPDGLALDASTGIISGTPTGTATISTATIQAADSKASGSLTFYFSVYERLVINPITPAAAHVNAPYSLSITGQGSSAIATWTIISGQLPPGLTLSTSPLNANMATVSGRPTQTGAYAFTIQATDYTLPQTATLATSIVVDSHLAITKATLKDGEQSQSYSDTFMAVNGAPPFTWAVNGPLPPGLTLSASTGQVSGTPTQFGTYPYTVTVTDSNATPASDTGQASVNIVPPMQIVGSLNPAYLGQPYTAYLTAIGGFNPYTWSVSSGSLAPGLSLYAQGGYITGTPTQLGTWNFVLQVSDSASPPFSVTQAYTMNVTPTPVNVSGNPLSPAPVNVLYHSQIPISGGTPPYTLAIISGNLPPGLTLDLSTGYIDGNPTNVGTYNFVTQGTDSSQPVQTATANDFIQIRQRLGRNDSIATATPLANSATSSPVLSISPYIDPINATTPNPDNDYYRLIANSGSVVHVETFAQRSWGADTLDSVIELLDQNGARLQTCVSPGYTSTCLNDDMNSTTLDSALDLMVSGIAGTQKTFYVHVFDWRGDARPDMQYYLNISGVVEPLKITTTLGPGATRGVSYSHQMTNSGGTGTVSWSVVSGALPTGWTLSTSGLLNGMATTDGTYSFTIQAQDSGNPPQTAQAQYVVLIAEPLSITSSPSLPNSCLNRPYSFQVTTSGGVPPISYSFYSSSWTSVNFNASTGLFSGTPTSTGTFTGMMGAGDSAQPSSVQMQTVTLTVASCP